MSDTTQHAHTAGHTPGPWRAEGWNSLVVNAADGSTICLSPGASHNATLPELQANAALIAAAPDLLAEVQHLTAERDALRAEADKLRDAIEEALTWRGTDTTHAKLRAALERPEP